MEQVKRRSEKKWVAKVFRKGRHQKLKIKIVWTFELPASNSSKTDIRQKVKKIKKAFGKARTLSKKAKIALFIIENHELKQRGDRIMISGRTTGTKSLDKMFVNGSESEIANVGAIKLLWSHLGSGLSDKLFKIRVNSQYKENNINITHGFKPALWS
jgi:hypothetical protein